ncbi:MAG: hypothetical protein K2X29_06315 [Candidatus Obscuribacterales bacterium]|nr:hypothetical protein [Candidatus Obscuribacterales bacterium]
MQPNNQKIEKQGQTAKLLPVLLAFGFVCQMPASAGDDDHVFGRPGSMVREPYTPGDPYTDYGQGPVRGFAGYPMTGNGGYPISKSDAGATESLRNPYIPGTMVTEPYQEAPMSQMPAWGDGPAPVGINPGDWGAPFLPPTHMQFPLLDGSQSKDYARSTDMPPSAPLVKGPDPGLIYPKDGGGMPPVEVTTIQPQGGIIGNPPIQHWPSQKTRDLGLDRGHGTQLCDFGQPLQEVAVVKPTQSESGIRATANPQSVSMYATSNRDANLPNATATQNLYGNRQRWNRRNPPLRPLSTLVKR